MFLLKRHLLRGYRYCALFSTTHWTVGRPEYNPTQLSKGFTVCGTHIILDSWIFKRMLLGWPDQMNADCRLPLLSQGAKQGRVPCGKLPEGADVSMTCQRNFNRLTPWTCTMTWHLVQFSNHYFCLFLMFDLVWLVRSHAKYLKSTM